MKKNQARSEVPKLSGETPTVRERTLTHMKKLLREAATLGAGIALVCGVASQGCRHFIVDPPPPPPPASPGMCENPDTLEARYYILNHANWVKSGRKWTIDISLWLPAGVDGISFEGLRREEIHVSGASVKKVDLGPKEVSLVLTPIPGKDQVEMDLAMQCDRKQIPARFKLDISGPRKKKASLHAELVK